VCSSSKEGKQGRYTTARDGRFGGTSERGCKGSEVSYREITKWILTMGEDPQVLSRIGMLSIN